jgi:hypothetical protein
MLDNLRDQASFQEEEVPQDTNEPIEPISPKLPKERKPRRSFDQITGMNSKQRFILAVMLLVMVCLLGTMLLVITGKMIPSFLI